MGPADLHSVLKELPRRRDRRVLVDQSTLDDAGVFAYGRGEAWVQTADFFTPVVDDPYDFGQIAAANAVSDIYAMGGAPLTALALLCFPDTQLPHEVMRAILRGGQDKMREAGVSIIGGHSVRDHELKFGYAVTGLVKRRRLLTNAGARRGDVLVLTKPLGTGILSTALKQQRLEPADLRRLTRSMASLNRAASQVAQEFHARAATDVTGYGLLGHAIQMADASRVSFRVVPSASWFLPRTLEFAAAKIKPAGLDRNREFFAPRVAATNVAEAMAEALYDPQTSGGLLVSLAPSRLEPVLMAFKRRRVWTAVIGEVIAKRAHAIDLIQR